MPVRPVPPEAERTLGMGFYASAAPGVGGRLKATSDAFRVTEISSYPLPDPEGAYTVLRVVSRDWEQHELSGAIARQLGLATNSVQWAGTKDRRAVAERLLSYRGPPPEHSISLPRVEVIEAYRARDGLVLGHHYGNSFDLRVDSVASPATDATGEYRRVESELRAWGGFPNFFGPQRFGEVRPITHEVGRWVVRGELARAVDTYLIDRPAGGTQGVGDSARSAYGEHRDAARALREFPPEYRFERSMLERLARGQTPAAALRALSRDLRLLFVHAFQAYLFNRWMTARFHAAIPFDRPSVGDHILRVARDGATRSQEGVPVAEDNLVECSDLVRRGGAVLAGPLVGYETPPDDGPVGRLLERVLTEEGVGRALFRLPQTPELASRGAWRPVLVPVPPLAIEAGGVDAVRLRFALPKGTYATVLLREFLKTGASSDDPATAPT